MRLYHNPLCSKSRGALELLQAHGHAPEIVAYLEHPPSPGELQELLRLLQLPARALLRTGEDAYHALGLDDASLTEDALLDAMSRHPQLIERPILVYGNRAIIGRPPENLLEFLRELAPR